MIWPLYWVRSLVGVSCGYLMRCFSRNYQWRILMVMSTCLAPLTLSCQTYTPLYVSLRPPESHKIGLLRLAQDKVTCTTQDGTVVVLEQAGSYYVIHVADLEVILDEISKKKEIK